MSAVDVVREIGAWVFLLGVLAGVVWAIVFSIDACFEAWRAWRSEERW